MIAIKHSPSSFIVPSPADLLVVTLAIQTTKLLTICVMYCSITASDDYKISLIKYIHSLYSSTNVCIIMGDFNSLDIDWPSLTGCSDHSNALCDLVFDTNLCQLIHAPTQIKGNVLDLVFTSSEGVVKDLNIDPSYVHTIPTDLFSSLFLSIVLTTTIQNYFLISKSWSL